MLSFTMQAGPDPVHGPFAGLADSDGSLSPIGADASIGFAHDAPSFRNDARDASRGRAVFNASRRANQRRFHGPSIRRQRAHSRALRSCVRMTATASTSKPATSAISTPIVWPRTLGCGTAGRYGPAIDNGGSCMRRSDTPPQPGQSDTAGGRRAGQRRQRHATRAVRGKRDLRVPAGAVSGHGRAHTGGTGRIHHGRSQPGHGTSVRSGARGHARHGRRRDALVPHGRRRTRSAVCSTAPASEPFGDPGWTLRAWHSPRSSTR